MPRQIDKWFSLRTDFFGPDAHQLGFFKLSPQAMGLYVASVAHASRWGVDHCSKHTAAFVGLKRPSPVIRELVEHGFWFPALEKNRYHVCHEGVLWRRGSPNQRRTIPLRIRAAVMERDGFACVGCSSTKELSLDHIWPYSKGGMDTLDNLRVLCRSCNSAKGNRLDAS